MKIQCDVCNKSEASVFCTADEAALCDTCDHRVHHANKLASKHQRFSLLHPSSKQFPLCDICQEKRAFLFCQQDRAILCRECDYPIHAANEHTQKHNRYLLTGVKLSATSTLYGSSSNGAVSEPKATITTHSHSSVRNSVTPPIPNPPKNSTSSTTTTTNDDVTGLTSSISEYLIETLPGWHVEDLLESSPAFGFSKNDVGVLSPFWDCDIGNNQLSSFSSENTGIWVPQAPPPLYPSEMGKLVGLKETKEAANLKANVTRSWSDDAFTVPQINFPSTGSKRSRPFW